MRARATLLLALLAVPLAAANVTYSGTLASDAQAAPQIHCELVQASPRPSTDPLACNQTGAAKGVTVLRVRGAGVGSMYAGVLNNFGSVQLATLDCTSTGAVECKKVFSTQGVSSSSVSLYARAWGGGGASWIVTVERVPTGAVVPT